jgi:hypothetical protein
MFTPRLRAGERVRLRVSTPSVPCGTLGVVRRFFSSTLDTYEVVFDTEVVPRVIVGSELERVTVSLLVARTA